jgi:Ca2+-binding RTX toxin-like protein
MPDSSIPFDHAPVAVADTASVAAGQSVFIDVLANDTDVDPGEQATLGITNVTALMENGQPVAGTLQQVMLSNGRTGLKFTADDPYFDSGNHTVTFTYQVVDQWYNQDDPSTYSNARGGPVTVTINVTGNATPGEIICGTNHPQILTPDNPSHDPRIHYGLKGNDILLGGNSGDTIDGGLGSDTVSGDNGNDKLYGNAGADRVFGGNGNDYADGGAGNDTLTGDNGNDTLIGGAGNDWLFGGNSPDRFVFGVGSGNDVVWDFDDKNDKIAIDHNLIGSWGDLIANRAHQVGCNVVITSVDGQSTITLVNEQLRDLQSSDFIFT